MNQIVLAVIGNSLDQLRDFLAKLIRVLRVQQRRDLRSCRYLFFKFLLLEMKLDVLI